MINWLTRVDQRLIPYKKRFYTDLLLRGSLLTAALLLSYFIIAVFSEYFLWLSKSGRFLLLILFIGLAAFCFWRFLIIPLRWFLLRKGMDNEDAARRIGQSLPGINDRLLNLLQLSQRPDSALAAAAVEQRFRELASFF